MMNRSQSLPSVSFEQQALDKGVDLKEELICGFAARLIRRKARQLVGKARLTRTDQQDIEQELRVVILRRLPNFNPSQRHWNVFVTVIVERYVATILEARRTKKCEHSQNITSLSTLMPGEDGEMTQLGRLVTRQHQASVRRYVAKSDQDQFEANDDLAIVLSRLPADLRDLCDRLMSGSLSKVARDLGIPRSTLVDRIAKRRRELERAGLRSFLKLSREAASQSGR